MDLVSHCYCSVCNELYENEGGSEFGFGVNSLIKCLNSYSRTKYISGTNLCELSHKSIEAGRGWECIWRRSQC